MKAILVDDTKSPTAGTYGPALAREVSEIAKYQSNRHYAYAWARNLRFLVYDDEDDDEDEKEQNRDTPTQDEVGRGDFNDEEEKQLQQAITMSLAVENRKATSGDTGVEDRKMSHDKFDPEFESEQEMLDYAMAMSLQEDGLHNEDEVSSNREGIKQRTASNDFTSSCDTCKRFPRLPAFKKPTKFRVLQFKPEDLAQVRICSHYAAVSYCWRSDNTGTSAAAEKSYRIRVHNPDGTCTERINRAPNEIIDRAVDAASALGCRLIWIDQECLPQDNSREQELGIQAMDMVYQRALHTIGLFESIIQKQVHLDATAAVLYWGMRKKKNLNAKLAQRKPGVPLQQFCLNLLEFLELLADDWWNTRAWILQEAFSSSEKLVIFIRAAAGVDFHSPPEKVLHEFEDPDLVKGSCMFRMREVLELVRISKEFLMSGVVERRDYSQVDWNTLVERGNDAHTANWYERAVEVLERLDRMFPVPAVTTNRHAFMYGIGGANFGPRKTCNAAVALYFLRARLNHRPADRLAILANLCDYEVRLDTTEIENRFTSLSVCLATLALINGDLSLLVPEVYSNFRVKAPIEGPSWALPFTEILHSINNMSTLRAGYNIPLRSVKCYSLSRSGLVLPAALFNVNRKVDLTSVKLQWESHWRKISCLVIEIEWRDEESMEQHESRRAEVLRQIHEDYGRTDPAKRSFGGTYEWDFEIDPALGATIVRSVSKDHADGIPLVRALLGAIFMDILRYLYNTGEASLANSIWHSIRIDCASTDYNSRFKWSESNLEFLPDTVEELLQNQELTSDIWSALQLDPHGNGYFGQMWFVHRIMKYGFLWAGNYTSYSPPTTPPLMEEPPRSPKIRPSILELQSAEQMIAIEFKKNIHEIEDDGLPLGSLVALAISVTVEPRWERDAKFRSQVAAFDVDKPCTVAIPYDYDMERLPRPVVRSMAVAWVVEPVLESDNGSEVGAGEENGIGEGEWAEEKSTPPLSMSSNCGPTENGKADSILEEVPDVKDANRVQVDKGKGKMKDLTSGPAVQSDAVKGCEAFKVVDRVMGVWEVMRNPLNRYTFI